MPLEGKQNGGGGLSPWGNVPIQHPAEVIHVGSYNLQPIDGSQNERRAALRGTRLSALRYDKARLRHGRYREWSSVNAARGRSPHKSTVRHLRQGPQDRPGLWTSGRNTTQRQFYKIKNRFKLKPTSAVFISSKINFYPKVN